MGRRGAAHGARADRGADEQDGRKGALLSAAVAYTRRGWRVVPVRPGEKGVVVSGWQHLRLEEKELPRWFAGVTAHSIGLLTGEPSGGLVDVDCDAPEARLAAAELLPPTGMISGRPGNPASHYWYRITGELPATTKFADATGVALAPDLTPRPPLPRGEGEPEPPEPPELSPSGGIVDQALPAPGRVAEGREGSPQRAMLVELRSTGAQTVAPPSLHPSGELIRWERAQSGEHGQTGEPGEPSQLFAGALLSAVARVAAVALLARRWPGVGVRDEAALALAGMLLRAGWREEAAVDHFVTLVARIAGDEEWRTRAKAKGTAKKLAADGRVTGARELATHLRDGERVVAQVVRWLRLPASCGWPFSVGEGYGHMASSAILAPHASILAHTQKMGKYGADGQVWTSWTRWSVTASALKPTQVHWLWQGRIPLGTITLLDGDPGLGKSLITLDLAGRVTRGLPMPDGSPGIEGGAGAVLLSAEDDLTATILPRLLAAAADMDRVELLRGAKTTDPETGQTLERFFLLPHDLPYLEEAIQEKAARLVVIDPLMAFLDGTVNSWRDQDVRAVLAPLAALAERAGAAILILRHLNKATGMSAIQRGGGSIGIIGAARSGLLVAKAPDDPDHERVLASSKSNLGPPMPSLRYRIATPLQDVEGLEEEGLEDLRDVPMVEWLGECDLNATALLAASASGAAGGTPTKIEEAMEWLRESLAAGPRLATEAQQEAVAAGIAPKTLRRAREQLKLITDRDDFGGKAIWSLPPDEG